MALIINTQNTDKIFQYILLSEREEQSPFTLDIQPLKTKTLARLEDDITQINQNKSITIRTGSFNIKVFKVAVKAWYNLLDENNKEIKPVKDSDGFLDDESLNRIPMTVINEVANVILEISKDPSRTDFYLGKDV